ncbi:hypothetical protein GCM10009844_31890 [Nocardioides koreensis]|uniref:HTH cro/C1-type domain-containing protein n=1 Tax=Nocardioides koreensis TaxID=433651 RepID=A0ABP5LRV3_9ACTN
MARSPDVLDDPTPFEAPHVDVRVRIAWLLRSWRDFGIDGASVSVTEMAGLLKEQGIAASAPSVSGWETGRVAPGGAVVEAYEAVLGCEPGSLRGSVDLVRRRFGDGRPRSVRNLPTLVDLNDAVDRVVGTPEPTGLAWLHLSETALAVRPGISTAFLRPLVSQLVSEMSRAAFTGYTTRYEALALLRCGKYAEVVEDAVAEFLEEPGTAVLGDAARLLAERPDPVTVRVLSPLLGSDDVLRLRAGVVGLEHVAADGDLGPSQWRPVVAPFAHAWEVLADDEQRNRQLATLWGALPAPTRAAIAARLPGQTDPERVMRPGAPVAHRDKLAFCSRVAERATDVLGLRGQPLLDRLVFEAAFDSRDARRTTSTLLLMASPFRGPLALELAAAIRSHQDLVVRRAAATLFLLLGDEESRGPAVELLDSDDPVVVTSAIFALAHSGAPLDEDRLERLLALPDPLNRRALLYAGMTGQPVLARLAADPTHPLQQPAAWWLRHGGRVAL